jgi:hypothetical protein
MVRPTMEYASSVWDPTNRKKIGNLEKVQKRAARFVFNNYTDRSVAFANCIVYVPVPGEVVRDGDA